MIQSVFVELTNQCNCACKSCPQSIGLSRPKGYIDFELFKRVVNQAYKISSTINFSFFGEPTLHPRFLDCMKYLGDRPSNINIIIFSNFLNVTQKIMNSLIAVKPKMVHISINAATSETYDKIRSGKICVNLDGDICHDRFDIVCNKIRHWFKIPNHPSTRHEFVVSTYTINELKLFVKQWLPLLGSKDEILTKCILTYGGSMLGDKFLLKSPCKMWEPNQYLVIDWEGNVGPCFLDNDMKLIVGSIKNNTLLQIYNSQEYKHMKQKSLAKIIKPCDTCSDASHAIKTRIYKHGSQWSDTHLGDWL